MRNWLFYIKSGFSRKMPGDHVLGVSGYQGLKTSLQRLRPFMLRHWRKGLLALSLLVVTALFSFPQPLITRYIVDEVILERRIDLLAAAVVVLALIAVAAKFSGLLEEFYFVRFEQEVTLDLQQELIEKTFRLPHSFFDAQQTGYLMSRMTNDVEDLRWFFSRTMVYVISNLLRLIFGILILFYLEWRMAAVVFWVVPLLGLCVYFFSGKIHVLSHQEMEQRSRVFSRFQESLSLSALVKAFATEKKTAGRLISDVKSTFQISLEQVSVSAVIELVVNALPGITRLCVLGFGAYWIIEAQWTLGSLLAFQAYLGYVFGPAHYLASANFEFQKTLAALQRVLALLDQVPEENIGTGETVSRLKGEIEFKQVCFAYGPGKKILQDISFKVAPGERIAVVGPSGVGKTTLISLLLCFYRPNSGEIYFDARPVSDYDVGSLRERIGYVSQRTLLLSGSVMENLCYGNPNAGESDIIRACKVAGCYDFIVNLPEDFETEIGQKGVRLSEGQKQRLSLARALVKDPDVLILDEPTAALDSLAEKSIFDLLPAYIQGKTLIVAAHRYSTIKASDRILLLSDNRLEAMGTHESLMAEDRYYREIVAYQRNG